MEIESDFLKKGKLLNAAIKWFKDRGIVSLYLESGKDNHSAHAFFEKRGFGMVSNIYSRNV